MSKPPQGQPIPNKIVKLVFEDIAIEGVAEMRGCKVYLETSTRSLDGNVMAGEDVTVAERWAAGTFDLIRQELEKISAAQGGSLSTAPKKEDMN